MTEQQLSDLVHEFYRKVREDAVLGPVFHPIPDWPAHLERMAEFWSSVMLASGRYKGNPMMAHLKHKAAIEPSMFERWLGLWRETALEIFDPTAAIALVSKAERIAESLQLGLFFKIEQRGAVAA
jgi:hemoglobin